ncbi:MAG: hypothetical protein WCO60_20280 [Verrucomicrobiota bacterium]
MSETPRTDAVLVYRDRNTIIELARQLERELRNQFVVSCDIIKERDDARSESERLSLLLDTRIRERNLYYSSMVEVTAERDTLRKERDRLRDTKWEGIVELETQIAALRAQRDMAMELIKNGKPSFFASDAKKDEFDFQLLMLREEIAKEKEGR